MICAHRRDADPAAVTCNAALGGGKAVCACGVEVKAAEDGERPNTGPNTVLRDLLDQRAVRVPDSARGVD